MFGQLESVHWSVNETSYVSSQGVGGGRGGCVKDYLEGREREREREKERKREGRESKT